MIGCSMRPGTGSYNLATRTAVQWSIAKILNRLWAGPSVVDTMWKITASLPTDNRLTYAADGWGDAGLRSWPPERADMVRMPRHCSRPSESGGRRDVESGAALQSERQGKDGDSPNRVHRSVLHECEVRRIKRCREVLLLVGGKLKNGFGCEQEGVCSFKFRSQCAGRSRFVSRVLHQRNDTHVLCTAWPFEEKHLFDRTHRVQLILGWPGSCSAILRASFC